MELLVNKSRELMPGGVNSPVRNFSGVDLDPFFVKKAKGAEIEHVNGKKYLDYIMSWGPLILGHCRDEIVHALQEQSALGSSYGLCSPLEVEMAELVLSASNHEMIRFVSSGTESTMSAIRLARGATGRDDIIKFIGCYHGHSDGLLVQAGSGLLTENTTSSKGVPAAQVQNTRLAPYNDIEAVEKLLKEYDVAAIIIEPVAANMGVVAPKENFLKDLRRLCDEYGALLIFDEVITGFRLAFGGAAQYFGVKPDISCYGKIVGAGLPVGAYASSKEIMQHISPIGGVYQAGTLSGNPLAMRAGMVQLKILKENPSIYEKMQKLAKRLQEGFMQVAKEEGVALQVPRVGSLLSFFFTENPVKSLEDISKKSLIQYKKYYREMFNQGILFAPSAYESVFLSDAHTQDDIECTLKAHREALRRIK